ncbi:hypothetical protein GCM10009736_59940 [Actinomadura bangladeshensis]
MSTISVVVTDADGFHYGGLTVTSRPTGGAATTRGRIAPTGRRLVQDGEREFGPRADRPGGDTDRAGCGSGADVTYTTAHPAPDGDVALARADV